MITLIHVPGANSRMKDDYYYFFLILDEILLMANMSHVEHGSQSKAEYF